MGIKKLFIFSLGKGGKKIFLSSFFFYLFKIKKFKKGGRKK